MGGKLATDVVITSTQITAKTPAGSDVAEVARLQVDVVVTNPASQSATLTSAFTYVPPPTVTEISPTSGPVTGGTAITITGENFQDSATVTIGGNPATEVSFNSETELTAKTPEGSGIEVLIVTNPDTQSDTLENAFTYIPPPTVKSISPSYCSTSGEIKVTISGQDFQNTATVQIGDKAATVVSVSDTKITAKVPSKLLKTLLVLKVKFDTPSTSWLRIQ